MTHRRKSRRPKIHPEKRFRRRGNVAKKGARQELPNNYQAWSYQAWFDLGFVLNRLARADESIAAYRKSVAAKPDVFESNLNLGLMLVRVNHPDAEQFLRAATTLKPTNHVEEGQARAWLALAHLLESKKPEDAFEAYRKASELTPKDPEPISPPACCTSGKRNSPLPKRNTNKCLALDPQGTDRHDTEAAIGLTNVYMKSGRLGEAEPLLRRLAAERPDDAGIHLQLGRVLDAQGKKDDAITEIQTALKLTPADSAAQRDLADHAGRSKKLPDADKSIATLSAGHPNDPELHSFSARYCSKSEVSGRATGIHGGREDQARFWRRLWHPGHRRQ